MRLQYNISDSLRFVRIIPFEMFVWMEGGGGDRPCFDFQACVILIYLKSDELIHALHKNSNKCILVF